MTFNLKKSQIDQFQQMMEDVPLGYNPKAVNWLWNNMYVDDPQTQTMADMLRDKSPEEIQAEYDNLSNPEMVADLPEDAEMAQNARSTIEDAFGSVKKPFNLKKAQAPMPFGADDFNDSPASNQNFISFFSPSFPLKIEAHFSGF